MPDGDPLLGPAEVRRLAAAMQLRPTKRWGQNFVVDPNTVRRIVRAARLDAGERVLEVGPGLGSLTLGLLDAGHEVVAVEVDSRLADALPGTVADRISAATPRLRVIAADALQLAALPTAVSALVANLPYNVAVPVVLHLLATLPELEHGLVMVQAEVADRMVADPGSRIYGVPSVKLAWWAAAERAGDVSRSVFWPAPNIDSALVRFTRRPPPRAGVDVRQVFALVDAAFAQRRKSLRAALAGFFGSPAAAEEALRVAGIDPKSRGEALHVADFARLAVARPMN